MVLSRKVKGLMVAVAVAAIVTMLLPAAAFASGDASPKGLAVGLPDSSAGGCLELTWQVEDPSQLRGFGVYRSKKPDSGFREVFSSPVESYGLNVLQHVDTGLDDGATYYYKVKHTGAGGRELGITGAVEGELPRRSSDKTGGLAGKRIILSIADQRAYFLENEVLVKSHLISTGTTSHPTPEGVFYVQYHTYNAISVIYGGVYCYWWMGFYPDTGMHALPYDPKSKTWTSASCLGTRASHGCVRQAVADAEWAYKWTPDGTRIDILGWHYDPPPQPNPAPPPLKGGHASKGVSEVSKTWYFAEGCTSGSFDEYILMMNPTGQNATVNASFMKPDGTVAPGSYVVPAFSRYTIHVDDVVGLESTEVSVKLDSDQLIAAERSMYFDYGGRDGGSDTTGVTEPSGIWYLAEGYTGGEFDMFVLIQNPGDNDTNVRAEYMRPDGQNVSEEYYVKAHSRFSVHVDNIAGLESSDVSVRLTSGQPVIVERAQYFNYYGRKDGNASTGVTEPATTWYLAEGYTGGEFDTYVLLQNPGEQPVRADVMFMCSDGRKVPYACDIGPRSRHTIRVDDVPGLDNAEVSTMVEAPEPVVVERSMFFVSYGRPGGSDAPGVSEPATYWYLPEGYTGGDFDTYVLIMNPHDEPVEVDVAFMVPNSGMKPMKYTVGPNSRFTIHVDAVEGLSNTEVATALTAMDDKTIICERAMYFSYPRK